MSAINGKNILIGISGGIAAYKTPLIIREFIKKGANVKVAVSENALEFVTPLTLQTLCGHKIYKDMFREYENTSTEHISLAGWADCFVVAPATANIIGKYACGIADDCLTTSLLAFEKQVFICPAMNTAMYNNAKVQRNLVLLQQDGAVIIDSEEGFLACGTSGKGRMADIDIIVNTVEKFFEKQQDFSEKTVTITAGPTREQIDSVRFISNNSSGRMGIALTEEFLNRGAYVNLVVGHVNEAIPEHERLNVVNIVSASDMFLAAVPLAEKSDIIVCSAAVADYTPNEVFNGKMKKKSDNLVLNLVPTQDILAEIGKKKNDSQILVGFALETDNELQNAEQKLKKKNLDLIVLNSLRDKGAGFEVNTNKVTLIDKSGCVNPLPLKSKKEVAKDIVNRIKEFM